MRERERGREKQRRKFHACTMPLSAASTCVHTRVYHGRERHRGYIARQRERERERERASTTRVCVRESDWNRSSTDGLCGQCGEREREREREGCGFAFKFDTLIDQWA